MNELLLKAGLFGAGLVDVATPALANRYNNCLAMLGIEPTSLAKFRIDGVGWSPEVAQERSNNNYLSHSFANPYAVVLTPDQRRKPVYFPFSSYDRRLMDVYFSQFESAVADITSTNGLVLDIDHGMSDFASPMDLLLVSHVIVRSSADGGLLETAASQKELENRLMNEREAWFDPVLRKAIMESARQHGDLCIRKLAIPEMVFSDLRSFYTEAFGGVFVIRTEEGKDDLLIVEEKPVIEGMGKRPPRNVFWVYDPRLLDKLNDGIVDVDFEWFRTHLDELDRKLEYLAADAVCTNDPELEYCALTPAQRRKTLVAIKKKMSPAYAEIERLKKLLEKGAQPNKSDLSPETQLALLHPHGSLPKWYREVVWQLICRITQYDPLRLYITDRNRFFQLFQSWPRSKQVWAAQFVAAKYVPHKDMKEE